MKKKKKKKKAAPKQQMHKKWWGVKKGLKVRNNWTFFEFSCFELSSLFLLLISCCLKAACSLHLWWSLKHVSCLSSRHKKAHCCFAILGIPYYIIAADFETSAMNKGTPRNHNKLLKDCTFIVYDCQWPSHWAKWVVVSDLGVCWTSTQLLELLTTAASCFLAHDQLIIDETQMQATHTFMHFATLVHSWTTWFQCFLKKRNFVKPKWWSCITKCSKCGNQPSIGKFSHMWL
jgi:hypothetical protein